jgi:protein disulfide-isomerase A1
MDCTVNDDTCGKHNVRGFPTIILFRGGDSNNGQVYEGARTKDAIVTYLKRQLRPAVTPVADEQAELEAIASFDGASDLVVVSYAAAGSDEDAFFTRFAEAHRDKFTFLASTSGRSNGLVLYRNFDVKSVAYDGELSDSALLAFLQSNGLPLCGPIGPENYGDYAESGRPLVWLFVDYEAEGSKQLLEDCSEAARATQGEYSFVHLDGVKWSEHAQNFGLDPSTLPVSCIEKREPRQIFIYNGEYTKTGLESWVANVKSGSLAPNVKSEPIPEKNDGPVLVLVGKTFEEVAYDKTKDVLVEFYAPWCGHCKSLAPKYEELGAQFSDDTSTIIAKLDATANDTPETIEGFPTLIFYPATQGREGEKYTGQREAQDLYDWVKSKKQAAPEEPEAAAEVHDEL